MSWVLLILELPQDKFCEFWLKAKGLWKEEDKSE